MNGHDIPRWFKPAADSALALRDRMRFRIYPKLADAQLDLATWGAKRRLQGRPGLAIMVDNCVLGLGVTHETAWISTGQRSLGNQTINTGYAARVPVHSKRNRSREYQQVRYLTGICHLARAGAIELCHSAELWDEQFRHPGGRFFGYGSFDYSLFSGIEFRSVDGFEFPTIGPEWLGLPTPAEQQRERIAAKGDELFREIYCVLSEQLGRKCHQDAWHIRTAEAYGLHCFLTVDWKLLGAMRSLRRKEPLRSLRTKVVSPAELGIEFGLWPVSPHLASYNDASWIVRSDRTMPREQRRKRSEYGSRSSNLDHAE